MTFALTCDNCGSQLETEEHNAGKTFPCPQCQHPLTVPAIEAVDDLDDRIDDVIGELQAREAQLARQETPRSSDTPSASGWSGLAPDGAPAQSSANPVDTPSPSLLPVETSSIELDKITSETLDEIAPDVPVTTPPLKLSWVLRHNRILLISCVATFACWLMTSAGTRYFSGGSLEVEAQAVALTTFGALLLVYGAVFCNLHTPVMKTLDAYLGKALIALAAIWMVVVCVVSVRDASALLRQDGQEVNSMVWLGYATAMVVGWSVFGLLAWLFWILYSKFGSLRVLSVQFAVVAALFVLATVPMSRTPPEDAMGAGPSMAERTTPDTGVDDAAFLNTERTAHAKADAPPSLPLITTPKSNPFTGPNVIDEVASVDVDDVQSGEERPFTPTVDRYGHPIAPSPADDADGGVTESRETRRMRGTHGVELPSPDAPDYFAELVRLVETDNSLKRQNALRVLNDVNPEDVSSADDRRLIARAYMEIAVDSDRTFERRDGIDGIVKWGGNHSVPILLDILEEDYSPIKRQAYEALGKLKDSRAALPVALRLDDAREHRAATRCLDAMGNAAEEGLIVAVNSDDTKVALTCIRLLQEHGSDQCLPILRKIVRNRNLQVREAAKVAIRCIRDRN